MRLKKNLAQMVESDYVPLTTTQEGNLQGGFGSISLSSAGDISGNNVVCTNPTCRNKNCVNPSCTNGECPNPICVNECTINNCDGVKPSPTPTSSSANLLIGF